MQGRRACANSAINSKSKSCTTVSFYGRGSILLQRRGSRLRLSIWSAAKKRYTKRQSVANLMRRGIMYADSLFNAFARSFEVRSKTDMSMAEYLESCRGDPMRYANAAERLLAAIGEPQMIDTAKDARLGRIFLNRTMRAYRAFAGFYGMEETIERIVGFFRHAAQGLEERKQILYLLRPVGGGKSSLAERLKSLMEVHPIYVLKAGDELSPVFESPLSLFDPESLGPMIEEKYGIPRRRLHGPMSPWCYKRLEAFGGDISRFRVAKIQPSRLRRIAVAKTEPGDENNQDISSLVGKVDIRKLETFAQNDPDAYSYSGGLNRSNQGVLEFVEMFKAPIKMLHPLLTATQEGNYIGTENIGAIPFNGVILAHSNEAEWQSFKANKKNEAFIDRICVIKVPYCLRVTEEQKIYEKLIQGSELASAPCAPATLETLARFSVMSRLRKHENSTLFAKMRVYDGESLKESDPKARSVQEYKDAAGVDEGMDGVSTRFAFKVLAGTFNPKDFRNEVVKFSLRSRAQNGGKNPSWTSYEKVREVIEKRIFSQVEDLLPVISFGSKKDGDTEKKHGEFVQRMVERGYTVRQVRRLVEWYMRVKQAG